MLKRVFQEPPVLFGEDFSPSLESILDSVRISLPVWCNLKCIYCCTGAEGKAEGLEFGKFLNIVEDTKKLGAKTIKIVGHGEPLLYPKLFELLDFIQKKQMKTVLFTNNTCITKGIARKLFGYELSVVAKLNSFDEKTQNLLCGCSAFNDICFGLNNLLEAGFNKTKPSRLGIDSVICRQNFEEVPKLFRFCRENNIVPKLEVLTIKGRAKKNYSPAKIQLRKLVLGLLEIDRKCFGFSWDPGAKHIAEKPSGLSKSCFIDENGFVYPTTASENSAGNILQKLLKEILVSKAFENAKKSDVHFKKMI